MARLRAALGPALTWALAAGGIGYFCSRLDPSAAWLTKPSLLLAAGAVLLHVMRNADPAWLISAGIAASMYSGHWADLGLGSVVAPDRVLLAAGVAALLLRIGPSRDRPHIHPRGVHFAMAAALLFAFVSMLIVHTTSNRAGVYALIDQFGLLPFVAFTVAPVAFRTEHQRRILLGSLVATGAYLSLTALFEKLGWNGLVFPRYIADPAVGIHFGRSRGPFAEAVANGLALYACSIAAVIAIATWRRTWERGVALAVAALSTVGLVLTVTRAVWLGAAVASVLVFATTPRLRRFLVPAGATAVVVVLAAMALIPGLAAQVQQRRSDQSPVWERKNSNAAAFRMIEARPLVGFGWYRHNENAEPYFRLSPSYPLSGEVAGIHNLLLTYAVDLGVVGFGLWLLAAALAFGGAVRGRAPPELAPWRIGLGALVACYLTAGIFGPLAYVYPTLLIWTWAGVAYRRTTASAPGRSHDLERLPGEAL